SPSGCFPASLHDALPIRCAAASSPGSCSAPRPIPARPASCSSPPDSSRPATGATSNAGCARSSPSPVPRSRSACGCGPNASADRPAAEGNRRTALHARNWRVIYSSTGGKSAGSSTMKGTLMSEPIRIAIAGYGNLGRGVESAVAKNKDKTLVGVFTRRDPAQVVPEQASTTILPWDALQDYTDKVDVLVLCGGSKGDLPEQGPELAALFNTVDSYDTHAEIPEYFASVDRAASQ